MLSDGLVKLRITKPRRELLGQLGIVTVEDLLTYYPYRYEIMEAHRPTAEDPSLVMEGVLLEKARLAYRRQNQSKMLMRVVIDQQIYQVAIFNRHFLLAKLGAGQVVTVIGKLSGDHQIVASDLKLQPLASLPAITPVYSVKEGITSKAIANYVKKALEAYRTEIQDFVPLVYEEKYRLVSRQEALEMIHCPKSTTDLKHALRHLKYEEFLKFQLVMSYMRLFDRAENGLAKNVDQQAIQAFISQLPFALTADQQQAAQEILADFASEKVMHRLVQGDVGSGKTVVAVIALYANYLAGYQGALMAPTEILAKQHAKSLRQFFDHTDVRVELLIGSMSAKEKEHVYTRLMNGQIDILVGTHALIQDGVRFYNLGLVIADEQHRFGVKQRQALKDKGKRVDILLMSATPIPRTLAISLFGDMDVSTIRTMPGGRKKVETRFYEGHSMKPILPFLKQYLATGGQCYVICPLVDESEGLEARDASSIYEAMKRYFKGHYEVGLLHGRMNDEQKEAVMQSFYENQIQILVSTTVVEVGVDVANANLMVIYNADRFGLSQLHQLRGRVGRSSKQGYCFLLSDSKNQASIDRVKFLETTSDGFAISNYDLKLRGPGEVLGQKQSGLPTFTIANIFEDHDILMRAHEDAGNIIGQLERYPWIAAYIRQQLEKSDEAI